MYGLQENGRDLYNIRRMFNALSCPSSVVSNARIGRQSGAKTRPMKITLSSTAEVKSLPAIAYKLKGNAIYISVYLKEWSSREEKDSVKVLRQQCTQLDKDCGTTLSSGKKRFIIINGHLMERKQDGKLSLANKSGQCFFKYY